MKFYLNKALGRIGNLYLYKLSHQAKAIQDNQNARGTKFNTCITSTKIYLGIAQ